MTTEERLAKVEGELGRAKRRSRWLLVGLALGLGALALVWASAASVPKAEAQGAVGWRIVRANQFVLEDENGKSRGVLGVFADGPPGLRLANENGELRASLGVGADGASLGLCDKNGRMRVVLAADGPRLHLLDESGELRVQMDVQADGPKLWLHDAAGKPRAMLVVSKHHGPSLYLLDETTKAIWSAP